MNIDLQDPGRATPMIPDAYERNTPTPAHLASGAAPGSIQWRSGPRRVDGPLGWPGAWLGLQLLLPSLWPWTAARP